MYSAFEQEVELFYRELAEVENDRHDFERLTNQAHSYDISETLDEDNEYRQVVEWESYSMLTLDEFMFDRS